MCIKYRVSLTEIAKIAGVSRQTVSIRINGNKERFWNENEMKKIWHYFKNIDNTIEITDLFF